MRMIERRFGAYAHELLCTDFNHGEPHVFWKCGVDVAAMESSKYLVRSAK